MTFTQVSSPILQISITSPAAGNYINIENHAEFNVSGNCPQSGETISVTAANGNQSVNAKTACGSGSYSTSLDLTTLFDGSVTITADRIDSAGNSLTKTSVSVTKDTVPPPAPTAVGLAPGTLSPSNSSTPTIRVSGVTNDLDVSIHAGDPSCALLSLKGSGKPTNGSSVDITSSDLTMDATYYFYAKATDPAGNGSPCSASYVTYVRDATAPTVNIGTPSIQLVNNSGMVSFTITYGGADSVVLDPSQVNLTTTGNAVCTKNVFGSDNITRIVTLSDCTGDGLVKINIAAGSASDLPGNQAPAAGPSGSFTVDNTAPTVNSWSMSPQSGSTSTSSNPTFTGDSDEAGILTIHSSSDSTCTSALSASLSVTTLTFTASLTSPLLGDGTKAFNYRIQDAAGNVRCISTGLSYTRDTTAPNPISLVINNGDPDTANPNLNLTLSATDISLDKMCVQENQFCSGCTYESFSATLTLPLANTTYGPKYVSAKFKDLAGNESACVFASIFYDNVLIRPRYLTSGPNPIGGNWNDYVKAPPNTTTVCDGTETSFTDCIHAGELKKVITPFTAALCSTSHTISDTSGAFDWNCAIENINSVNTVVFYGKLKSSKGLTSLLDPTTGSFWNLFSVIVSDGTSTYTSIPRQWWFNPINSLPANNTSTAHVLNNSTMIYTLVNNSSASGYNINADKIAVVIYPSATLSWNSSATPNVVTATGKTTGSPDARAILAAGSQRFVWIEGSVNGAATNSANYGLLLSVVNFSQLRNFNSANNSANGVRLDSSKFNFATNIRVANNGNQGVLLSGSNQNRFAHVRSYNNESTGTDGTSGGILLNSSNSNFLQDVITANNHFDGIVLNNSSSNIVTGLTSASQGSAAYGFYLHSGAGNILHNAVIANNYNIGLALNSATATTVSQLASGNNGGSDSIAPAYLSNHLTSLNFSGAFVGKAGSAINFPPADWFNFGTNLFRTWGLGGGNAFPDSTNRGRCTSLTNDCQTWDWSLNKDTISPPFANPIWNRTGTGSSTNNAFAVPILNVLQPCPSETNGDQTITSVSAITYLKNAVEIIGDGIGNENGLCETGDNCLYTPNFGAYQGHDSSGNNKLYECAFAPTATLGHLDSIRIFGYDTNGY